MATACASHVSKSSAAMKPSGRAALTGCARRRRRPPRAWSSIACASSSVVFTAGLNLSTLPKAPKTGPERPNRVRG